MKIIETFKLLSQLYIMLESNAKPERNWLMLTALPDAFPSFFSYLLCTLDLFRRSLGFLKLETEQIVIRETF